MNQGALDVRASPYRLARACPLAQCNPATLLPCNHAAGDSVRLRSRFRCEGGDDFLEARVATQRVPLRIETELSIRRPGWKLAHYVQLFQGEILFAGECVDSGEIREQQHTIDGILCRRKHVA